MASSMICGMVVSLGAGHALAQEAEVTEIVVTGSRIPQPNLTSVSPVQVVGAQEVTLGGRPVTADFLNQLPQVSQSASTGLSSSSNPLSGPGGVATVDLRGLGQTRTLVLVDGRRLGLGDPNTGNPNPSPDLNQIPSQLIERVDVLTGGASATYGSDAIAGVVNFIMKRDFEGLQVDANFGVYQHEQQNEFVQGLLGPRQIAKPKSSVWDGKSRDLSIIWGANTSDGRGNVTAFFTYHDQDPVTQGKRDYSACQINAGNPAGIASCAGSPNSNQWFRADGTGPQLAVVGNQFLPYSGSAATTPPPLFNSNEYAYLLQQSTRYTAGFFAKYDVNDHVKLYSDFSFMNDRTSVQIAPTGLFQGSGPSASSGFLVNCNNPFMSAQQQGAIGCTPAQVASGDSVDMYIGRRNIEGGGRVGFYEHQNYRVVLGSRGDIVGPWTYDLYGSYYYTSLYQASQNYLSISRMQNALQVVQGANGPECISGGSCVPYNIFKDGGVTPEALSYLALNGTSRGAVTQRIVEGSITGDLSEYGVKSPWANDGVGVNFGFQNRRENLEYAPDAAQLGGDLSGAGGASVNIDKSISVTEGFAEARIPVIQDMTFARDVVIDVGYRYSDYSTGIKADTYKGAIQWAPTDDIRFRASYQRAIRAPNLLELYTPQSVTNTSDVGEDPCAQGVANRPSFAQCANTGVTQAQYNNVTIPQCPSGQCAVLTGGNPNLEAEKAKTIAVGFTLTPTFLSGLTASLDYYTIDLKGTIGTIPLGVILQRCLQSGEADFCSQIRRNASNGSLFGDDVASAGYFNGANTNVGSGKTSGIDVQANYNLPLDAMGWDRFGQVSVSFNGAYLIEKTTVSLPGDPAYDCAGLYGASCDGISPRWRSSARVNWTTPWDVTFSAAWRYIGESKLERDTNEPTIGAGGNDKFNHMLPSRTYVDLASVWNINDTFTVRAGVNNVLDQDPPLISRFIGTGLPNTYPVYDLLGRKLFVGFTANF